MLLNGMRIPLELRRRFLMGGLSRREYEQYKADAKKRIWDFKLRHSLKTKHPDNQPVPGFPNLLSLNIAKELVDRVNQPKSIDQGDSSLCGAASVMFCWLSKRPDLYVQYVINVCETGVGKMGDLSVRPGTDNRNYKNQRYDEKLEANVITIPSVDWIALAALTDSENAGLDYDSAADQIPGITFPRTVEKWFKNIGYYVTGNETNLVRHKGFAALREAAAHLKYGESVCLFINANIISKPKERGLNMTPNHWVVMESEPMIDGQSIFSFPDAAGLDKKTIDFKIFTWGGVSYIKDLYEQTVTVKEFLSCFYGFVSAEYPSALSSFEFKVFSWWIQHHGYNHNNLLGW